MYKATSKQWIGCQHPLYIFSRLKQNANQLHTMVQSAGGMEFFIAGRIKCSLSSRQFVLWYLHLRHSVLLIMNLHYNAYSTQQA